MPISVSTGTPPHRAASRPRSALSIFLALAVTMAATLAVVVTPRVASAASASTSTNLNLRAGPGTGYAVLTVMPTGSAVTISGDPQNGFYPVSFNGTDGWAYGAYLTTSGGDSTAGGNATVTSDLNLRAGPSLGDAVLLVMPTGAAVTLTGGSSNGFLAVSYNGTSGWAYGTYLDIGGGSAGGEIAVVTTPLNLRDGPSTSSNVLTVMPAGSTVETTGDLQSGFYPVKYSGVGGYAYGAYLDFSGTSSASTDDSIIAIIYAAADRYGQPREDMLRVARCESGLDPNQVTPPYDASGLFQFLPGTWATTPYADQNIFDPVANANAAAWMWSVGRRNEWVCQ